MESKEIPIKCPEHMSNKHSPRLLLLAAAFLFGALSASGESLYQGLETFHAEFSQQLIHASHAAGQTNASVILQTSPSYDINPVTDKNEGLKVGNGCASLSYSVSGNLPATAGSIEVMFKPIDWAPSQSTYNIFFQTATSGAVPPAKLYLYKASLNGIAAYLSLNSSNTVVLYTSITNWQNHIYHHMVFTYDAAGDAVLFIDGAEVSRKTIGTPSDPAQIIWPSDFTVGPAGTGFGSTDGQTAVERVRIYNTVLSSSQISYLAGRTEFNQLAGGFSKWFQNNRPKPGLEALDKDTVPVPWSPVSYSNLTASCWNRQYDFSGSSLLEDVTAGAESLLSAPSALHLTVGGQLGTLSFGSPSVVTQGLGRIVLQRTGSFGNTSASMQYTFEYDGLLWCDLQMTLPSGSSLEELTLKTFLDGDIAQLTHFIGAPTNYTSQNLPKNSYSKVIPETTGIHHLSEMKTMVWIGNNKKGLLWCTESDQYWWPKDRTDCISIDRQPDGDVALYVHMVTSSLPTNAPQTLSYSFGFMATPTKALPEGWRAWTHTDQAIGRTGDRRGINVIYWPSSYRFMMLDHDPSRYVNVSNTQTQIHNDVTNFPSRYVIPYWTRTNIYDEYEEADPSNPSNTVTKLLTESPLMTREWATKPHGSLTYRMSATTEWSDYIAWSLEEFAEIMDQADGIYMDEVQPIPNTRAESSGGYDGLDGIRRPTFELFGTRNLLKRLDYNTWQRNEERPRSIAHCSGTESAHALSAFDLWLIGEQYNPGYFWQNPELKPPANNPIEEVYYYSYALPMERVRAECYPQQWGHVIMWLPQLKDHPDHVRTNAASARDMLSRVLQADVVIWPLWCNTEEIYKTWEYRKDFGIGEANVSFHPYWEQTNITASLPAAPVEGQEGWWDFNETSGIAAADRSGQGNNAYLINMSSSSRTNGVAGNGIRFVNDGGYIDCGQGVDWSTMNAYTVSFWLKPETTNITGRHLIETHSGNTGFYMQLHDNNKLCTYQSVTGSMYSVAAYDVFPHDTYFHHVAAAFRYDGTNSVLKTYVDGVLKSTKTAAGEPDLALAGMPMKIGHGAFTGIIDDVKVYSYALDGTEIANEYLSVYQALHLKFNDAAGTTAKDHSSYGQSGVLTNMNLSTAWSGDSFIRFSNDGGYVTCGTSALFEAENYTIDLWLRPITGGTTGRHLVETHSGTNGFYLQLHSNDKLCAYQGVSTSMYTVATYADFPHDGAFHHAAVTFYYDGINSTMKTYLDGILVASNSKAGKPNPALTGTPFKIGHGAYEGDIRNVRFHARVLSDSEIYEAAQAAAPAPVQSENIVAGYYSKTSGEYLALVSNLSRNPQTVCVDFSSLSVSNAMDAETEASLPLNAEGNLILEMKRNDYRAIRIN